MVPCFQECSLFACGSRLVHEGTQLWDGGSDWESSLERGSWEAMAWLAAGDFFSSFGAGARGCLGERFGERPSTSVFGEPFHARSFGSGELDSFFFGLGEFDVLFRSGELDSFRPESSTSSSSGWGDSSSRSGVALDNFVFLEAGEVSTSFLALGELASWGARTGAFSRMRPMISLLRAAMSTPTASAWDSSSTPVFFDRSSEGLESSKPG